MLLTMWKNDGGEDDICIGHGIWQCYGMAAVFDRTL